MQVTHRFVNSPLIVVLGPTGSGKSDLALRLAQHFSGEIVNFDSVQLYRGLDIGTAKTPLEKRAGIPHHLIDILNPDEHFTAGDYARVAQASLAGIAGRDRIPILTGGTGFYLRALLEGLPEAPGRDAALRERLSRRRTGSVHRLLSRFDPESADRIHPNDVHKSMRALEIFLLSGKPASEFLPANLSRKLDGFRVIKLGLDPPREELVQQLDLRCVRMFSGGLLDEVRGILARGIDRGAKALLSIGYSEAVLCLEGRLSLEQAITLTQTATRQYAKRQLTWFRREAEVHTIHTFGSSPEAFKEAAEHLETVL